MNTQFFKKITAAALCISVSGMCALNFAADAAYEPPRRTDKVLVLSENPSLSSKLKTTDIVKVNRTQAYVYDSNYRSILRRVEPLYRDSTTFPTEISIPKSFEGIANAAFAPDTNCVVQVRTTVQSVTLPEEIKYVEFGAFIDCTSLTDIYFENPDCQIAAYAFGFHLRDLDGSTGQYYISQTPIEGNPFASNDHQIFVHGYKGSTAENYCEYYNQYYSSYCRENNLPDHFVFVDMGGNSSSQPDSSSYWTESSSPDSSSYWTESSSPDSSSYWTESSSPDSSSYWAESSSPDSSSYWTESSSPDSSSYWTESSSPDSSSYWTESSSPDSSSYWTESSSPDSSSLSENTPLKGDVNFDGKIAPNDALEVLKCVVKLRTIDYGTKEFAAADFDNDNAISVVDASLILKKVVGIID